MLYNIENSARKIIFIFFCLFQFILALPTCASDLDNVIEGDLAFVINRRGNAITSVTTSIDTLPIDHVAIMHRIGGAVGPLYALESIPESGVVLTPIDSFIVANGGEGNILIGRVRDLDAPRSLRAALTLVGRPYDYNYTAGDSTIYCSELVQTTYVNTDGQPIFETIPMTFRCEDGTIHPYWVQHYSSQGLPVPEGLPGSNPGQLSRNKSITFLERK